MMFHPEIAVGMLLIWYTDQVCCVSSFRNICIYPAIKQAISILIQTGRTRRDAYHRSRNLPDRRIPEPNRHSTRQSLFIPRLFQTINNNKKDTHIHKTENIQNCQLRTILPKIPHPNSPTGSRPSLLNLSLHLSFSSSLKYHAFVVSGVSGKKKYPYMATTMVITDSMMKTQRQAARPPWPSREA